MDIKHWPGLLRAAGIKVVETSGWQSRSHGSLRAKRIVWHHDASPFGDSPGALNWMISNWNNASAQIWVDRYGTWHFVGSGVAYHAGRVFSADWDSWHSVGIETDHTVGEDWPKGMLASLRKGTAVLLKHEGLSSASMSFHKIIASPAGRKQDPDGLDLNTERQVVQSLINGAQPATAAAPAPTPSEDFLMALSQYDQELTRNVSVEAVEILRDISNRLRVPGYPFDWLPAINNNIMGLGELDGNETVDVDKLAASIMASLPEEIVAELVSKLAAK